MIANTPVVVAGRKSTPELTVFFYETRGYQPVWVGSNGLSEKGQALIEALGEVDRDALDPRLYVPSPLPAEGASADDLARAEIEISAGLLRYAHDVSIGIAPPNDSDENWRIADKVVDQTGILMSAATAPDMAAYVDSLAPQDTIYTGLRKALKHYRTLATAGVWQPLEVAVLQPGMTDESVPSLRRSLVLLGDLPEGTDVESTLYDEQVVDGMRRFQRRHGLSADGTFGKNTRAAFNVSPQERVQQIIVNMERRRWMPTDLGAHHIIVNLPDYRLEVIEEETPVLDMRVVVGSRHGRPRYSAT
ncbi:MAG: hypothetical protein HC834_01985 [Rhodospirillales bacterium]|nr:hypothetical protein [Rhodospirillales bacterium]